MRYLTFNQLREKLGGRGRTTIYRDIAAKRLPPPIKLGGLNYFSENLVDEALMGKRYVAGKDTGNGSQ
jgi:prophage regulatory protein